AQIRAVLQLNRIERRWTMAAVRLHGIAAVKPGGNVEILGVEHRLHLQSGVEHATDEPFAADERAPPVPLQEQLHGYAADRSNEDLVFKRRLAVNVEDQACAELLLHLGAK